MVNGHAMLEHMIQQSAAEMGMEPLQLRVNNLMFEGSPLLPIPMVLDGPCPIADMIEKVKQSGGYDQRRQDVDLYNKVLWIFFQSMLL